MARGGGNMGIFSVLIGAGAGILALVIMIMLMPVVGGQFDEAMPALDADSDWNASYNTDLPTGVDAYTTLTPFLQIVALVALAMLVIGLVAGRWG
jgi:predicted lipid-binding transport protein (Tim44 family)